MEFAREEEVVIFCLPPHTTQDSQPLDTSVFGPLKRHWTDVCHKRLQSNPGMVISKYNFSEVFSEAWMKALTPGNIVSGFKKCGIYPFNRDAIPVSEEAMSTDESESPTNNAPTSSNSVSPANSDSASTSKDSVNGADVSAVSLPEFTDDEIDLFEKDWRRVMTSSPSSLRFT